MSMGTCAAPWLPGLGAADVRTSGASASSGPASRRRCEPKNVVRREAVDRRKGGTTGPDDRQFTNGGEQRDGQWRGGVHERSSASKVSGETDALDAPLSVLRSGTASRRKGRTPRVRPQTAPAQRAP